MTTTFEIPLQPRNQELTVLLGETYYRVVVVWNDSNDGNACWVMDIFKEDGTPVLQGVPLVSGGDLLDGLDYLEVPGKLFCGHNGDLLDPPKYGDLGSTSHLYWEAPE